MTYVEEIRGTITHSDGKTHEFVIGADMGWQQWGETQEVLGRTVDLVQALAEAADEFMQED